MLPATKLLYEAIALVEAPRHTQYIDLTFVQCTSTVSDYATHTQIDYTLSKDLHSLVVKTH